MQKTAGCFVLFLLMRTALAGVPCRQAQEIGSFGISPWGSSTSFADQTAKWLTVDVGLTTLYFKYVNYRSDSATGKLHVISNSSIQISINGVKSGKFSGIWKSSPYSKIPFTFHQAIIRLFGSK